MSVSQAEIRAEIGHYVCAAWLEDVQVYEARFSDIRCVTTPSTSNAILRKAVQLAIVDSSVIVPLAVAAYDRAYAELEAPGERQPLELDEIVHEAYWADVHLGMATLARSAHYLAEVGSDCNDCPSLATDARSLTWVEFAPYIAAYVWPALAEDDGRTHIHVCSGANGIDELGLSDSRTLEAGFLAAVALAEDDVTRRLIEDLVARNLDVPTAREAIAELIGAPAAQEVVCRRIEQTAWFTGVVVKSCER